MFPATFGGTNPNPAFDGNGVVNFTDTAIFRNRFGRPPGPSGLVP